MYAEKFIVAAIGLGSQSLEAKYFTRIMELEQDGIWNPNML